MDRSYELFNMAKKIIPGGVHSPVRSFNGLYTTPRFIQAGRGAFIIDVDGKDYLDFCMGFGPLVLGHLHPQVTNALKKALDYGLCFGACEPYSLKLVHQIKKMVPFVEQVRLVNSGTEAVMTALRLARGITGKEKIVKFDGHYHGHTDAMLIKAGSGLIGMAEASSAGIPASIAQDTLILPPDNINAVEECFSVHKNIAAVILEPLSANQGLKEENFTFLSKLQKLCQQEQILLIFDEVISGFRVAPDGISGKLGIIPDLVTYGKIIGGGLPVGAIAGSTQFMERLAPVGDVYQAGTLSGNPLAMAAGLATLQMLDRNAYSTLEENTVSIVTIFNKWLSEFENGQFSDFHIKSCYSLFYPSSSKGTHRFASLFKVLLDKGIYLSPSAWEVGFISTAHDKEIQEELKERLYGKN